jgi:hypothetical protein
VRWSAMECDGMRWNALDVVAKCVLSALHRNPSHSIALLAEKVTPKISPLRTFELERARAVRARAAGAGAAGARAARARAARARAAGARAAGARTAGARAARARAAGARAARAIAAGARATEQEPPRSVETPLHQYTVPLATLSFIDVNIHLIDVI